MSGKTNDYFQSLLAQNARLGAHDTFYGDPLKHRLHTSTVISVFPVVFEAKTTPIS